MAFNISNINIPKSPFLDTSSNRPTREWLLYLLGLGRTFAYGSFQNTASQNFAAANTPTLLVLNQTDSANGMYYQTGDGIHVTQTGIYNVQYSLQMANPDTTINEITVWLKKNGVNLAGTGTKFSITTKHGSVDGYGAPACNFFVQLNSGDYVELWASVTSALMYIEAYPAIGSVPSIPSTVVTLSQISL